MLVRLERLVGNVPLSDVLPSCLCKRRGRRASREGMWRGWERWLGEGADDNGRRDAYACGAAAMAPSDHSNHYPSSPDPHPHPIEPWP